MAGGVMLRWGFCGFVMMFFLVFSLSQPVRANEAALQERFEAAFVKSYSDPSNVDAALDYANLAVQVKDYEAAIPPLERILMYNPELTEIKLELGIMYFNLGSLDMAKTYFDAVLEDKNVSADVAQQAKDYLGKL